MSHFRELFACVHGRPRPEDVAELVRVALGEKLSRHARALLEKAAAGSLSRNAWAFSSMSNEFFRARVNPEPQVRLSRQLFATPPLSWKAPRLTEEECRDPVKVEAFVRAAAPLIHKAFGERRRLDKRARHAVGLFKGHRWYNKRFRLLVRLERKIERILRGERRFDLVRISKSSLATKIPFADFARDLGSACLVAYLASRMSLRSEFTCGPQVRAYDEIAEALLSHCESSNRPSWLAIAHVLQDRRVVRHLTEEERGRLLAASFDVLRDAGELLREVWEKSRFDRKTMIVSRGCDSSTWNEVAGAWNKARDAWISLIHALGMESLLDVMLPGKVLRLMAADVAAWHRVRGGGDGLHPDTKVWADLPAPWDVIDGKATCHRRAIAAACARHRVSSEGWIGPRQARVPVPFRPTPELVHGVTVSSPALALTLRRLGVFSGSALRDGAGSASVAVVRDEHGFALFAMEKEDTRN